MNRGTLGKLLATKLWLLPVGSFKKIAVPYFPKILPHVLSKMNNDVQMLYHLSLAVISGNDGIYNIKYSNSNG